MIQNAGKMVVIWEESFPSLKLEGNMSEEINGNGSIGIISLVNHAAISVFFPGLRSFLHNQHLRDVFPSQPAALYHAIMAYLCLISTYSPRLHLFFSSLTTIQGSFPCSNRVITSGLEMEHPALEKKEKKNKGT